MRRTLLVFTAFLLLAAPADAAPSAPGFRVTTLDGRAINSNGLIGQKVIVLRFQASYCKPCVKESAALSQVAEKYRDRGVEVLAIHVQDATPDVRAFVEAQKATYAVQNLPYALETLTRTTLRNIVGEMELDQTLGSRDMINKRMR